jgi:hypothetical protein
MKQAEGSAQGADKRIACHAVRVAACLVRCLTTPSREVHLGQPPRLSSNDSLICVGVVQLPKKTQRQCIIQYVIKNTEAVHHSGAVCLCWHKGVLLWQCLQQQ